MSSFNMPGADKFMSRLFRRADGVVWDLMTGKIGVQTTDGIATLDGTPDENGGGVSININMFDDFGMPLPAFAQSTPISSVNVGDIIYRGDRNNVAWVVAKNTDKGSFKLMKPNGETANWVAPKVSMLGLDSGVMVLRSLMTMLPAGDKGLGQMQNMLLPLMMMGGENVNLDKMMPLMLMSQMNGADASGGSNMAQMMMLMSMMGGNNPLTGKSVGNTGPRPSPFK